MHYSSKYHYDLDEIATYAHGVGPDARTVMYYPSTSKVEFDHKTESAFIQAAHAVDLQVWPWTLRDDQLQFTDNAVDETALYFNKGVDGVYTEFVSTTWGIFETMKVQEKSRQ